MNRSNLRWNTPSLATLPCRYDHCCTRKQNWRIPRAPELTEYQHPVYYSRDFMVTRKHDTLWTTTCLQEINTHWQITWPNVLRSYFTQSDYGANLDEKSTNSLQLRRYLTDEIKHLNIVFIKNNYTTDFIEHNTYIRPTTALTTHTAPQPLYLTYQGPTKP